MAPAVLEHPGTRPTRSDQVDAIRIQDAETLEEIRAMVERLARKVESIVDPETRDGLEDATDVLLAAMPEA